MLATGVTLVAILAGNQLSDDARYTLIVMLSFAMGIQNATVRKLAVPDPTTTVLTSTVTELAAESQLAGGSGQHTAGGLLRFWSCWSALEPGGMLVLDVGIAAALGFATGLLVLTGLAAYRVSAVAAPWTAPP